MYESFSLKELVISRPLIQVLKAVSMKLFEQIIDEEQIHLSYFENVDDHITKLGNTYLPRIAGTPATTDAPSKGFIQN